MIALPSNTHTHTHTHAQLAFARNTAPDRRRHHALCCALARQKLVGLPPARQRSWVDYKLGFACIATKEQLQQERGGRELGGLTGFVFFFFWWSTCSSFSHLSFFWWQQREGELLAARRASSSFLSRTTYFFFLLFFCFFFSLMLRCGDLGTRTLASLRWGGTRDPILNSNISLLFPSFCPLFCPATSMVKLTSFVVFSVVVCSQRAFDL